MLDLKLLTIRTVQNEQEVRAVRELQQLASMPATERRLIRLNDPQHTFLVAVLDDDTIVRTGRAYTEADPASRWVLSGLACQVALHRENGIGRTLVGELEAFVASKGGRQIRLNSLERVVGFYLKLGYRYLAPGSGSTMMYKQLPAS